MSPGRGSRRSLDAPAPIDPLRTAPMRAGPAALELHHRVLGFDGLALNAVLHEPYTSRWLQAGVDVVNVTVYSEDGDWDSCLRAAEQAADAAAANPLTVQATTSAEILAAKDAGELAVILGTQGAMALGRQIERVRVLHDVGVRFLAPAYSASTLYCGGCGERGDGGLTFLGRELIELVNELGMLVDLSHVGHRSRLEVAQAADHPVCTHSNSYSVYPNDRNTKDETAAVIAAKGGVVGVCCLTNTVAAENPTLDDMLDHVDYYAGTLGIDHVGFGFDLVEAFREQHWEQHRLGRAADTVAPWRWRVLRPDLQGSMDDVINDPQPYGIETIANFGNVTQGLLDRGYSAESVEALIGGNWFRAFSRACG